jgi:hypothetical protein
LFADDATYSDLATAVVRGNTKSWDAFTQHLYDSTAAFSIPMTLVYWVFSPIHLLGQLLCATVGAFAAVATSKVASFVVGRPFALFAGMVVALLPSQVLFSSLTLKDAWVWASTAGIAVVATRSLSRHGRALVWSGLVIVLLLVALAHLRMHSLVVTVWALAITALVVPTVDRWRRTAFAVLVLLLLPFAFGAGPGGYELIRSAGHLEQLRFGNALGAATSFIKTTPSEDVEQAKRDLDRAQQALAEAVTHAALPDQVAEAQHEVARAQQRVAATATTTASVEDDELTASINHLPKGLAVMLIEPYPWAIGGNSRVKLAGAELVLWYPLLILAGVGIWMGRRRLDVLLLPFLLGAASITMYALAEGNFGTAYRHRGEAVWVIAVFAAVGAEHLWKTRAHQPGEQA